MAADTSDKLFKFDRKSPTRFVGLVSILIVAFVLFQILWPLRWNLIALWAALECFFYVFYWRPRFQELNAQPKVHKPAAHDAQKHFKKCINYFKQAEGIDYEMYYSGWFLRAKFEDVKRGECLINHCAAEVSCNCTRDLSKSARHAGV
eukprot:GHRR01034859.1.p1 GENE.GHRR01034859.1~~GHRR01034859.1.p1  ORF type:complete len:148 (+),score=10.51 GHRR01034859.1:101-544(+)